MIVKLILMFVLSLGVSTFAYPFVLRYARRHGIVDNPDARKVHRLPVPVMGGVAVYAGILVGSLSMWLLIGGASINWSLMAMTTMLVVGVWDDRRNLPALFRLVIQFCLVGAYMKFSGHYIHNLYGLFGLHQLSLWIGVPLSLVAGVGIINAINMIDGIDGYSSGFVITACIAFGTLFIAVGQHVWSSLAVIVAGALIPFFLHNVFGKKTKMFIGDGGTMMLGFLMAIFALGTMSLKCAPKLEARGVGLAAFALSVLSIPVFDTLRVMVARIIRGHSPFRPDKSHLHHLFIDMGFSHLGAAISILIMNLIVILVWLVLWKCGASIDVQTVVVMFIGFSVTFGLYKLIRWHQHHGPLGADGCPQGTKFWKALCRVGAKSNIEKGKLWSTLQKIVDGDL